jgi:tetratricopeptide (TPR) repeat protein
MKTSENGRMKVKVLRVAFGILIAAVLLSLVEIGLWISGYLGPSSFEDPYLGFEEIYPLFGVKEISDGDTIYATNPNKLKLFNHQEFTLPKPPGQFRIFCFGGSTTYGRPFKAQTAYPHWLEILLNAMDPTRHYEVINAGGISYASYRIVNLVTESLQYEPDLIIIHTGHNEFLERRTYEEILERSQTLRVVSKNLSRLKLYDLLRQVVQWFGGNSEISDKPLLPEEVNTILEHSAGLDFYSRKLNQKQQTFSHYRDNLTRMVQIAMNRDVPIVFVNMVSNLADFSPFKSEHRDDLTTEEFLAWDGYYREGSNLLKKRDVERSYRHFREAWKIDPHFANLCFLMGRTSLALGRVNEAHDYFFNARDEDICPLRAPGAVNEIIYTVGEEMYVPVIDLTGPFIERNTELAGHKILGNALFFDHLHPTIEGHQLIGNQLARSVIQMGITRLSEEWDPEDTRDKFDEVLNSLDNRYFADGNLNLGKVLMWARKVEEALVPLKVAVDRIPENADAHYTLGTCLSSLGKSEEAIVEFRQVLAIDPRNDQARNNLALELRKTGDLDGAMREFMEVLKNQPSNFKVLNNIGLILYSSGDLDQADRYFRTVLDKDAKNPEAHNNLGLVYTERRDYRLAEDSFRKASELRPNYKEALHNYTFHNNLGEAYLASGNHEEARIEFSVALSLRPGWEKAQANLDSTHQPR